MCRVSSPLMEATGQEASTSARCPTRCSWTTPGPCSGYPYMPPPTGCPSTPRPASTCCWSPGPAPTSPGWKQKREGTCMQRTAMPLPRKLPGSSPKSLAMRFCCCPPLSCLCFDCFCDAIVGLAHVMSSRQLNNALLRCITQCTAMSGRHMPRSNEPFEHHPGLQQGMCLLDIAVHCVLQHYSARRP